MTLRDLKPDQIAALQEECSHDLDHRRASNPDIKMTEYQQAWTDGVRAILRRLDYLPSK